jgi:hypothetical protein
LSNFSRQEAKAQRRGGKDKELELGTIVTVTPLKAEYHLIDSQWG